MAKITPAHWKAMFLDLFFSDDESAVGNNLFGKIPGKNPATEDGEATNHLSTKK